MADNLDGSALSDGTVTEAKLATAFSTKVTNAYNTANVAYGLASNSITSAGGTINGNLTVGSNLTVNGSLVVGESLELINVSASGMSANLTFDVLTQPILYLTSSATANCTVNFRGNSTVGLDSFLTTGQSLTVSLLVTNGSVGYKANVVLIDGVVQTPKWAGAVVPQVGNPFCIDLYSYTIVKTAPAVFTVLASQQKYG